MSLTATHDDIEGEENKWLRPSNRLVGIIHSHASDKKVSLNHLKFYDPGFSDPLHHSETRRGLAEIVRSAVSKH